MRFGEVNCVFMGSYYIHRVIAGKPNRLASAGGRMGRLGPIPTKERKVPQQLLSAARPRRSGALGYTRYPAAGFGPWTTGMSYVLLPRVQHQCHAAHSAKVLPRASLNKPLTTSNA